MAYVPSRRQVLPATPSLRAITETRPPQPHPTQPIAFMRPNRFSSSAHLSVQSMPVFNAEAQEQAKKNAQSALASAMEDKAYAECKNAADQKLAAQLEEVLAKKCEEFSTRLERRLDSFYEQTATRLDFLSEEVVRHFCEVLNRQMTEALSSVMSDWTEQNRVLMSAECRAALDRFASRLENISSSRLENHREEIQNLSANLKNRLRGVAHALEELGPTCHRT
ncbi:MAG: hypothetical protein WA876_15310 [Candidatus Acidiferrales bacterium]